MARAGPGLRVGGAEATGRVGSRACAWALEQGHLCMEAYQEEVIKLRRNSDGPWQRCPGKCYLLGRRFCYLMCCRNFFGIFMAKLGQGNL